MRKMYVSRKVRDGSCDLCERNYRAIMRQGESASVDKQTATKFPNVSKKITEENVSSEQIIRVN